MKKNLSLIVLVALAVSVINVFAIINSSNDTSIQAYAKSNLCTAQGDFMPAPFEEVIVEEISNESNGNVCSAQGDVRPPAWDEEEDDIPTTASAQGDVRPPAWDEEEDDEIIICSAQGDVRPPAWDEKEDDVPSGS